MNIQLIDLKAQYNSLSEELDKAILDVLSSANYIMGKSVFEFEREFATYLGVKYAISVGNGTDALVIALKAMDIGEGDEVITSTFTFFATAESISAVGATPVFVDVNIQNNVSVYTGVICEDGVFLGPSCVFTNVINPRSFVERKNEYRQTLIRKGASIGANSTIVCGHTIGKYALIGAGSVITKDVPDYALVFGNPGKIKGHVCKCGNKLIFDDAVKAECIACNEKYYKDEQGNVNGEES